VPDGFETCDAYYNFVADEIRDDSYIVSSYWLIVVAGCLLGNVLTFYGFGVASERLNKRLRDDSFTSLMRQDVSYFDKRSVGTITSQLQDDTARIHAFSGEPVRAFLVAVSSVVTGVVLSLVVRETHKSDFKSDTFLLVHVAICALGHWLHSSHGFCFQSRDEAVLG